MMGISAFLNSTIMMTTTFLLACIGAVFSERAGVVNIGIEGMMLMGALMGVVGSWISGSVWIGLLLAAASAMLLSLVFGYFTISLYANQTVVGVAINILASGFTILVYRTIFGLNGEIPEISTFKSAAIPLLSKIPILGTAIFEQPVPVYIAFLSVPLGWFIMEKMNIGLIIRCIGNNPEACDSVGISVSRVRYGTILFSGIMAGFGGAFLSMGQLSSFTEGMVAGRGFIVLAAIVFGNYTPVGVLGASLLFGATEALQYRLQVMNQTIPTELWATLPYIITLFAICVYQRKSNRPVYSGRNYVR